MANKLSWTLTETLHVQICFGASRKWRQCEAALVRNASILSLLITNSTANSTTNKDGVCASLSQRIPLTDLLSANSNYTYVPHKQNCVEISRLRSQAILISFSTESEKEQWLYHLRQPLNKDGSVHSSQEQQRPITSYTSTGNAQASNRIAISQQSTENCTNQIQLPLPVRAELETPEWSDSESDDGLYESVEKYRIPPPPQTVRQSRVVQSSAESVPSLPPPLPRRGKLQSQNSMIIDQLYRQTNDLLVLIHQLDNHLKLAQSVHTTPTQQVQSMSSHDELLIDLGESEDTPHFDSIAIPAYPSPSAPSTPADTEYLQPVSRQSEMSSESPEPVYAEVVKKAGTLTTSNFESLSISLLSTTCSQPSYNSNSHSESVIYEAPPLPPKLFY